VEIRHAGNLLHHRHLLQVWAGLGPPRTRQRYQYFKPETSKAPRDMQALLSGCTRADGRDIQEIIYALRVSVISVIFTDIDIDFREPCRFSTSSLRSSDRVAPVMRASSDSLGRAINVVLPTAGVRPFSPGNQIRPGSFRQVARIGTSTRNPQRSREMRLQSCHIAPHNQRTYWRDLPSSVKSRIKRSSSTSFLLAV
jgi:hypothetical protein